MFANLRVFMTPPPRANAIEARAACERTAAFRRARPPHPTLVTRGNTCTAPVNAFDRASWGAVRRRARESANAGRATAGILIIRAKREAI